MDNPSLACMTEETEDDSVDFIQEKSEQFISQDKIGHLTHSACEGNSDLTCMNIMLPPLESSVQTVHQEENEESTIDYEGTKLIEYNYDRSGIQRSVTEENNKGIQELNNIQVINVVVEGEAAGTQIQQFEVEENQLIQVHQNDAIVQNIETLKFEATTNVINESINNDKENTNSHLVEEENLERQKTSSMNDYEIEAVHENSSSEEYNNVRVALNSDEYNNMHQATDPDYASEDYVDNKEIEESLEHCSSEVNHDYEHLTTTTEIQLQNETVEEVISEGHESLESGLIESAQETYEVYSNIRESEEITEINDNNKDISKLVATAYRQKNIINIAAASANIDIQDSESEQSCEISHVEEESQIIDGKIESCQVIEQDVNVDNNEGDGSNELDDSQEREMLFIEKGEETASEVIEEIYFIQDVSSCSSSNYEQNKEVSLVHDKVGDKGYKKVQEEKVDFSMSEKISTSNKSGFPEKSRNVIQDIFDDWRDENADEDNAIFTQKVHDTVEIELNNLLNDNKKNKLVTVKETQQKESTKHDDYNDLNTNRPAEVEDPVEGETICIVETPSLSSSSSSSLAIKKGSKNYVLVKDVPNYVQPYLRGTYTYPSSSLSQDHEESGDSNSKKKKTQLPRLGVKVPSRHLKSQIATPAEVTEVLKERLREKQKDLETPQAADIVFVKKLTQRFASKICAGGTLPVSGLMPLSQHQSSGSSSNSGTYDSTGHSVNTKTAPSNDNPDNRELLAILEGDVDPDWSNLKPQSSNVALLAAGSVIDDNLSGDGDCGNSNSNSSNNLLSKLNPSVERELALKQLLEMPTTGNKRLKKKKLKTDSSEFDKIENGSKREKVEKSKGGNGNKKVEVNEEKAVSSLSTIETKTRRMSSSTAVRKPLMENDSQNTSSLKICSTENRRFDETRSGRKRKPTEKALEQYANKRQKMHKMKSPTKVEEIVSDAKVSKDLSQIFADTSNKDKKSSENLENTSVVSPSLSASPSKDKINKKQGTDNDNNDSVSANSSPFPIKSISEKVSTPKKSSDLVRKELVKSPSLSFKTRKISNTNATKRLISHRVLTLQKKPSRTNLQHKHSTSAVSMKRPVGRPAKVSITKSTIGLKADNSSFKKTENQKPKKKRKTAIKEIDKLLQDEGVVNLLYDVGQPRKRRLIPITKSQKKIMDIDKAERDLNLRKKLVKSTVLGLRGSDIKADKIAYRTKRRNPLDLNNFQKTENSTISEKRKNSAEMSNEFIYPAKIRNAADASVIVRRHSSSSFSSVSGSPRVSIDSPLDGGNGGGGQSNDETNHGLRSTAKRKQISIPSTDKDSKTIALEAKQHKQEKVVTNLESTVSISHNHKSSKVEDSKIIAPDILQEDLLLVKKQTKMENSERVAKKCEKDVSSLNLTESSDNASDKNNITKVTTRSNSGLKTLPPKIQKKRGTSKDENKTEFDATAEDSIKSQDELSACLAEAATALSSVVNNSKSNKSDGSNNNSTNNNNRVSNEGSSYVTRRSSLQGGTTSIGRRNKGITSANKKSDDDITNSNNTRSNSNVPQTPTLNSSPFCDNKEINVCRDGNLVQLILTSSTAKITLEVMQELCGTLTILKTDMDCRVVLFTSIGGTSFCEGLDLSSLLHTDEEIRKIYAEKMANAVKEFIKCLATFNKPLVAGVQGAAVGLGVTILPLFDLVIASDKATFYTPYGKLGQIPEGAAIMTLSHVHGSAVASELLLGGRTLTASEALRAGLVTRVLWPERFPLELLPSVKAMSEQSSQSMEATKALLRQSLRNKLNAALDSETHILVKQWCSNECQEAIKTYTMKKLE